MAKPRIPKAKAKALGSDKTNPARFEGRNEPAISTPLGDAPSWMVDTEKSHAQKAWNTFRDEIPWLNHSHRALVEIAASIRGRLRAGGEVGVQGLNLLRQALGQMGASPADASKVGVQPDGEKTDAGEEFFG